ncbi:hypothetical protein ACLOJK_027759 [Asimina triloba]
MKLSSKTVVSSSPNRVEKFPTAPQLLSRFSRSSGASRSRGRSRAGPIFFSTFARKKAAAESEPSSPKVTCIGQVRVRRSKPRPKSTASAPARSFCGWLQTALFCNCFARRNRSSSTRRRPPKSLRRLLFVSVGKPRRKKVVQEQEEPAAVRDLEPPGRFKSDSDSEEEEEEEEEEEDRESKIFVASTPPKNALLLMRCRSEPRRTSALADRFWGSPPSSAGTDDDVFSNGNRPPLPAEGNDGSSAAAPMQREEEQEDEDDENAAGRLLGVSSRPLILTRCKSEPSTRTANLVPDEACLWKNRRLGFATRGPSPHAYLD